MMFTHNGLFDKIKMQMLCQVVVGKFFSSNFIRIIFNVLRIFVQLFLLHSYFHFAFYMPRQGKFAKGF
jgi:hypothetical protein